MVLLLINYNKPGAQKFFFIIIINVENNHDA